MSGEALRDSGMAQVLAATPEAWKNRYNEVVAEWFADLPPGSTFIGEALRAAAKDAGMVDPHHVNVWSAVAAGFLKAAVKARMAVPVPPIMAQTPQAHARLTHAYRKI